MDKVQAQEIQKIDVETELKKSYLDYAMSVIVGRALPDARDGLKPVHRRVLYAMHESGNDWNKPYRKSARIVGDVMSKYHPHGEMAIYDTVVRMAQPFSMRYMLIDGQGNFGSVDGDTPAAMRYTEVRRSRFAHYLLEDIDKQTVEFVPNYDESEMAPTVLPTRVPNLLLNGSSGIAVGMATNIPPHNLKEIIQACLAYVDKPTLEISELMQYIPGPDFPTAGIIYGTAGIREAYHTGRGRVVVRARTEIETDEKSGREKIIVTELPYQVNKARLIERIAELVKEKKITSISALRDESDREGMRVVIELKRGENVEVVRNQLYSQTQLQTVFGINMVALLEGEPRILNLKQLISAFIEHRRDVVMRRSLFELRKAKERAHILEGLATALSNIDEMIALIKSEKDPNAAKAALLENIWKPNTALPILGRIENTALTEEDSHLGLTENGYRLSPAQAQAILEMRLQRLTGLEQDKILGEHKELADLIQSLLLIINDPVRLMQVIREELVAVEKEFGDERRTQIIENEDGEVGIEDLISDENVVVTISHQGYVKTQPVALYAAQHRGGRGKSATQVKEEDFVEKLILARMRDYLLCFTNHGKVYWVKVYQLPQAARAARGKPIINILPLSEKERVTACLPVREFSDDQFIVMATALGVIKKVALSDFSRPRSSGIIAVDLRENDALISVAVTRGSDDVLLFSAQGKVARFSEEYVRAMGRQATGVRGIKLAEQDRVVSMVIGRQTDSADILTATQNGFGKRTSLSEYRQSGRGVQGVISIQVSERNGEVIGALAVKPQDEILLISSQGTLVRVPVDEISVIGRNTQGVKLIQLAELETLVAIEVIFNVEDKINEPIVAESFQTVDETSADDQSIE